MANFRTHMGAGVVLGIGLVVAGLIYSLFSKPEVMAWVFLSVLAGSFLPDLDLDEGVPFQIIFGLAGVSLAGFVFYTLYDGGDNSISYILLVSLAIFVLVRFGAGFIFKRFTDHRGIFHSIPAAILFGIMTAWLLKHYEILQDSRFFLGLGVAVGYLGHLVLDEIYSTVDFSGSSLLPKKSLGSALKLYSSSGLATLAMYILLVFFVLQSPDLIKIIH